MPPTLAAALPRPLPPCSGGRGGRGDDALDDDALDDDALVDDALDDRDDHENNNPG